MIKPGLSYKFTNMVKKGETCWVVSGSTIAYSQPIKTLTYPQHKLLLPEEESPACTKRLLNDALQSPQKSTIRGKIVQVSPLTFRKEGTLAVKSLILKDESQTAKVVLFDKNATATYIPDSIIEISGLYKKNYQNQPQLTSTTATKYQYLPADSLPEVHIDESDKELFKKDPDFNCMDETTTKQ